MITAKLLVVDIGLDSIGIVLIFGTVHDSAGGRRANIFQQRLEHATVNILFVEWTILPDFRRISLRPNSPLARDIIDDYVKIQ